MTTKDQASVSLWTAIYNLLPTPRYSLLADVTLDEVNAISADDVVDLLVSMEDAESTSRQLHIAPEIDQAIRARFGKRLYAVAVNLLLFNRKKA